MNGMTLSPGGKSEPFLIHPVTCRALLFAYSAIDGKDKDGKFDSLFNVWI